MARQGKKIPRPDTRRYTSEELLDSLRLLATDYNVRPSQKKLLKDSRMATHHTYIQRFDSYPIAMEKAGVEKMEDARRNELTIHDRIKVILEYFDGMLIIDEFVRINGLIVDFHVSIFEKEIYIDVVDPIVCGDFLADWAETYRPSVWTSNAEDDSTYILVNSMNELRTLLEEIQRDMLE
jgi:hypothetical protein